MLFQYPIGKIQNCGYKVIRGLPHFDECSVGKLPKVANGDFRIPLMIRCTHFGFSHIFGLTIQKATDTVLPTTESNAK